jgi:hypothetical protein
MDLNRGGRFYRQGRIVYVVDSSCVLVGACSALLPGVWAVMVPNWSHVLAAILLVRGTFVGYFEEMS